MGRGLPWISSNGCGWLLEQQDVRILNDMIVEQQHVCGTLFKHVPPRGDSFFVGRSDGLSAQFLLQAGLFESKTFFDTTYRS